jgi:glycosyltransferase involved in cell wall biosynthesis
MAFAEGLDYLPVRPEKQVNFCIVSCERNAGAAAVKCLDSVYRQRYDRHQVRHIFIDDASSDDTDSIIRTWFACHPDHNVVYIRTDERRGGTANTLHGIGLAEEEAVVVELNGDDWLASRGVLRFLNKVYADDDVWMTYNTLSYINGLPALWAREVPKKVIEQNSFRDYGEWITSALHSFRKKLFDHLEDETFIDPDTGELWESSDDQALYLSMLELSGHHSRHLHRVTYVYNFREDSHCFGGNEESEARAKRIRQSNRYEPLEKL